MRYPTKLIVIATALAALAVACSNSTSPSPTPSLTLPSPAVSAIGALQTQLCDRISTLRQTLSQVQASASPDLTSVQSQLANVADDFQKSATNLKNAGQNDLAAVAGGLASSVNMLNSALSQSGLTTAQIQAAVAVASVALQNIPSTICPSPGA